MKVEMENWEIQRVKDKISKVLELWAYDFIEVNDGSGRSSAMSKETFLEALERELKET